jgi:hypothetical protein
MFVIFHKETTLLIGRKEGYANRRVAMQSLTRECTKRNVDPAAYDVCDAKVFHETIEKKETRIGIASCAGQEYEVGVNTPWTSGPWSETYWSA